MDSIPFVWRLAILALAVAGFLALDLLKAPGERHRWREYLFLAGCGAMTALFGMLVDAVTSRISADYFVLGKGIGAGPGFAGRVAQLGAGAGLGAGLVGGGIVLLANRFPADTFRLFRLMWLPLVPAAMCGALAGLSLWLWPWYVHPAAAELLPAPAAHRFTVVWFVHLGVYGGGALGLVPLVRRARQPPHPSERSVPPQSAPGTSSLGTVSLGTVPGDRPARDAAAE